MRILRMTGIAILFLLTATMVLQAEESGQGTVRGTNVRWMKAGGIRYVPLSEAAAALGLTVGGSSGMVNLDGGGRSVKVMPGRRVAIVNSSFVRFQGPIRNVGGTLCVPEDFLTSVYGSGLKVTGKGATATDQPPDNVPPVDLPPVDAVPLEAVPDRITGMDIDKGEESTVIHLNFNQEVEKSVRLKSNPDETVATLSLNDTASDLATSVIPVDSSWLANLKYIRAGDDKVMLKITGKVPLTIKAYQTGRQQLKIVVQRRDPAEEGPLPVDEDGMPAEISSGSTEAGLGTLQEVTLKELQEGLKGIHAVIAIDPGHGGSDFGVEIDGRIKEKTIAMEVAARLASLLTLAGQKPFLVRSGDYFLRYDQRLSLISERKPALSVSLHCNAALGTGRDIARGMEFFVGGTPGSAPVGTAGGETLLDPQIRDAMREILSHESRDAIRTKSFSLARAVEAQIGQRVNSLPSRGVNSCDVLLLNSLDCPAVHLELGFLTHPVDVRLLDDPEVRDRIALGLFHGIRAWLASGNPLPKEAVDAKGGR